MKTTVLLVSLAFAFNTTFAADADPKDAMPQAVTQRQSTMAAMPISEAHYTFSLLSGYRFTPNGANPPYYADKSDLLRTNRETSEVSICTGSVEWKNPKRAKATLVCEKIGATHNVPGSYRTLTGNPVNSSIQPVILHSDEWSRMDHAYWVVEENTGDMRFCAFTYPVPSKNVFCSGPPHWR
jgi:hypothetical protein